MSRILLIEDDPMSAVLVERVLTRMAGHQVRTTQDGDEVVELAESGQVNLILMNVSLSNSRLGGQPVDGLELSRRLKSSPTTAHIPILLTTAHAMRGDRESFLHHSGADGCLTKPVLDHRELCRQIDQLTSGQSIFLSPPTRQAGSE